MNKLFTKIASLSVGLALAVGVGVAVGGQKAVRVKAAEATWNASSQGFSNEQQLAGNSYSFSDSNVTVTFNTMVGSNGHKYFNSGSAVRSYGGESFTIACSAGNLTSITLSNNQTKVVTADVGTYSNNSWTGSAASVTFTVASGSGNFRTSTLAVVYEGSDPGVTYTISYNSNGGSGTMADTTNTIAECTFTAPEGKKFYKWNTAADGSGTYYNPGATASSDLDLFAIWEDNPYSHAGTSEDPFTVAEGIAKCKENGTTAAGPWVVKGIISKKTAWDSGYTNVTYWISDDGTGTDDKTKTIQCFRGKYLEGADVTSSNEGEFAVGKIVKVTGNLVNYSNNTPEYAQGNYPLSIEEPAATKYSVVSRIDNGSLSVSEIYENTQLSVSVVPELGYYYPSSLTFVRVAGVDVPYTYENGVVTVAASYITGNVVIEGTCVECNPIKSLYAFPAGTASGTVYGYYVGSTSDGPVIMDGEYGILLYKGSSEGLVEGETIVEVSGTVDSYNGLGQIKNATITVASGEYPAPATPVTYAAAGGETREYASRLTTVSGVPTLVSGNFTDAAGTNDITMNFAVSGATIQVFYKKAAQTADADAFAAVKEAVTNSTSVTIKGFTGWYNGFQVQMNGYVAPAEGYTAEDFAQDLLDQTDAVCTGWKEGDNNHDALVAIWTNLASNDKYPSLPDDQKEILAEAERDESGTVVEQAMARYDFLTGKYNLSNFINGRTPIVSQRGYLELNAESNNNTMIIIVVIASVSAISLATLLILKKKKHN